MNRRRQKRNTRPLSRSRKQPSTKDGCFLWNICLLLSLDIFKEIKYTNPISNILLSSSPRKSHIVGYAFTGDFWRYVNSLPIFAGIRNIAGFSWDNRQGIWYSQMNPIQRKFGYCHLYDSLAPLAAIFIEHKKMPFLYNNKEWMIWLWKGQYGITTCAEIGLYVYSAGSWIERNTRQKWYRCAYDSERIKMSFTLYKNNKKLFNKPYQTPWWLTGFKPGVKWWWERLLMYITLGFHNFTMACAFCSANHLRRPSSSQVSFWW